MTRIAVTGGIACGKSLFGAFLAEQGFVVYDADELAHDLMMPGMPVFSRVVEVFGTDILGEDGAIDRKVLGDIVFSDADKRLKLNTIVHPEVKKAWMRAIKDLRMSAVVVPLLYEAGEGDGWDAVICVSASEILQIRRLVQRGLSETDAGKRIAAQMPVSEKMVLSDYVVINDGTKNLLREQTMRVLNCILEKDHGRKTR